MAVVKNLMIRAGADFSSMRKEMQKANRNLSDFKSGVSRTMKGIGVALATLGIGAAIRSATKEAMGFEASLQQVERMMGSSASAFENWAKNNAAAFGMGRAEAVKFGAVFSNLISSFASGTSQTAQYTQDLLKASAVIASSTGRTMEDVMDRIRSGMLGNTEAIEDLGVNVNVAMIESTDAFKRFANGKSWQQLNFQTQQQIRLFAILEQSAKKYGTEIAQNTASRQAMLVAQLKNTQLALGQAFLPIYNAILPALTRFATALANIMNVVAQFTQALFGGGDTKQQTKATTAQAGAVAGLGDAYEKAGKQAKGSVAGFDQVNLIGGTSGGAADAAGGGVTSTDTNAETGALGGVSKAMQDVSKKAQEMAAKVKAAFKGMSGFIQDHKDIIIAALAGIATAFAAMWLAANGGAIAKGALKSLSGIVALANPMGLIAAAIATLVAAGVMLWRNWDELSTKWKVLGTILLGGIGIIVAVGKNFGWLLDNILKPLGNFLSGVFMATINGVGTAAQWLWKNAIEPLARALGSVLSPAFKAVADIAKSFWQNVLVPLGKAMKESFVAAVEAVSTVLQTLLQKVVIPLASNIGDKLKPVVKALGDAFLWVLNNALKPTVAYLSGGFVWAFDSVFKTIGELIKGLKTSFIGLMTFITGTFTGDWRKAWNGVKDVFKGVFDSLWGIVKFPLNLIIDGINRLISGLNKISIDIPDIPGVPGGGTKFGINIPRIPKLATGGLAFGPTLATVGDNRNAAMDPEVIAPLSKLEAIMGGNDNREVVSVLKAILSAIKASGSNDTLTMSKTDLARAAASGLNDITRRTGRTAIVT